jgi:hypothetical protein
MRLQTKPERWMCLPASFAMALDIPLADVLHDVGHDGSQIVWPQLPEPMCRRGFHPQELIDVCLARGYAATRIELAPAMTTVTGGPELHLFPDERAWTRFIQAIQNSLGVIEGVGFRSGHAVAYDHGHIFDPDGVDYAYAREACEQRGLFTQHLWRIDKIGGCL